MTGMVPQQISEEISEEDERRFFSVVATELSDEQKHRVAEPDTVYPLQEMVMALHWHPEHVPLALIENRIAALYPNQSDALIIPTQHNVIECVGEYAGVEVDCYSKGFNQKVQLLLHFDRRNLDKADALKKMLAHTFKYRSSQLFEFIRAITKPDETIIERAVKETGADADLVAFVRAYVKKVEQMLSIHADIIPPAMVKNKVIANFFDTLRSDYDDLLIYRAQTFLKAVKTSVKAGFSLQYFYRTSEVIEEARSMGAGIVIPHPEQFWPILLANYDVDGYEVWNPQSQRYTDFLISVLDEKNRRADRSRRLLVFMGDDTHMGEKIKDKTLQDPIKAGREIGLQPAWDDYLISRKLILASMERRRVIDEYRQRLAG